MITNITTNITITLIIINNSTSDAGSHITEGVVLGHGWPGHPYERWEVLLGSGLPGTTLWCGFSNHQAATAQMGT